MYPDAGVPEVRRVLRESRSSSLRLGRCPFIVHREPEQQTTRAADALRRGRMEHRAQVLPEYASKAFNAARTEAAKRTNLFDGLAAREMPTLHEVRALSSHLYARAGYDVSLVQELMAHTDLDMTRAYQKGHARKVLRVEMLRACASSKSMDLIEAPIRTPFIVIVDVLVE